MSEQAGEPRDVLDSSANVGERSGLAGGMGVSSERVCKLRGSAEPATYGTEDTSPVPPPTDPPPEHSPDQSV